MKLEDLKAYQVSLELGEIIYEISVEWDHFDKKTLGIQVVRSADSIAANISEGYGRYFYKDSRVFFYYARGSAHETNTWIRKAHSRQLISDGQSEQLHQKVEFCIALLNGLIKSTGTF